MENNIEESIKIMEHWIEYEKNNKEKINRADELINIQETILSDYKKVLKENEILKEEKEQAWEEWNNLEQGSYEIEQKLKQQIKELRKENEELKEKENKIYKEVQESLAFEKFLIVKERKPDLFNQGRFYISQIIYDILNDAQNPEGIHKENKCIQYIDYISVQKIKAKIEELDIAISECIYLDDDDEEYKKAVEKDKLCLLNKKRALQELLEGRK